MNVTLENLLEAGVHFGHQIKRWNPKMKNFIYTHRNGVHIIDLSQTLEMMQKAASYIEKEVASGKNIIFVGTKRQAKDIIVKEAVACGAMYINNRWPGGLITNFPSVKNTISKYNKMLKMKESKETEKMTKKDLSVFNKDLERKEKLVGGIKNLTDRPDLLFVLDVKREINAIREAKQKDIPVISICDTNSNPDLVTIAIPGND
ncbi:MAG: 30S ribosomal protein S2, partial [Parcubacteria group bacterium GW2011_GWE2_40_8]